MRGISEVLGGEGVYGPGVDLTIGVVAERELGVPDKFEVRSGAGWEVRLGQGSGEEGNKKQHILDIECLKQFL